MRSLALLIPAALLAGCAASSAEVTRDRADQTRIDAKLAAELNGLVPGKPTDCIPAIPAVRSTKAYGPVILYKVNGGLIYRNDTTGGCEGMMRGDILITDSHFGRECSGDISRTVQPGSRFRTGSCALGAFTPYRRAR